MDVVEFRRDEFAFAGDEEADPVAAVWINGADLRVLIGEAGERAFINRYQREPVPEWFDGTLDEWRDPTTWTAFMLLEDVAAPSRHWLGAPTPSLAEGGRAAVLNCTCGCFPCGGATALIVVGSESVTWSNFTQANSREEFGVGPFEFARSEYEAQLRSLGT